MYFTFPCPSCGKKLKVRDEAAGRKANCPYCKTSVVVPSPPDETPPEAEDFREAFKGIGAAPTSRPASRPEPEKKTESGARGGPSSGLADRTDVNILRSALVGLALSAGFLVLVAPFYKFYLGELFLKRGWVPFALVFLMGWSVAILLLKSRKLQRQRASMLFDLLPSEIADDITAQSVDKFVEHIQGLPVEPGESFLVGRVLRGLEHFRVRRSNPEVASMLASHSEIDANAVQSSYTLLNVFIWAIPILGFIGTVIGISAAVGGFSGSLEQAEDISVLKDSLNNVTGGLATAFDTTLVALVMSMLVMFPSSSMQKAEEDLLNWVDEYCNENLIKRLNDGGDLASPGDPATVRRAIDEALAPHHAELRAIGAKLTEQIVEGWTEINKRIESRQTETLEQIHDLDAMAASFLKTLTVLAEKTDGVHRQAAAAMGQSAESIRGYVGALERGLRGLNDVLAQLGEKQVVVHTRRRRGWFFRRNDRG
jgi:biopolymer transport protein ExbB/TolQ/DNA-directed RNA polymerase subunit RPC12/RpoP